MTAHEKWVCYVTNQCPPVLHMRYGLCNEYDSKCDIPLQFFGLAQQVGRACSESRSGATRYSHAEGMEAVAEHSNKQVNDEGKKTRHHHDEGQHQSHLLEASVPEAGHAGAGTVETVRPGQDLHQHVMKEGIGNNSYSTKAHIGEAKQGVQCLGLVVVPGLRKPDHRVSSHVKEKCMFDGEVQGKGTVESRGRLSCSA